MNIYSNSNQSALKYLKNTQVIIHNVLIMTGDFNIRDRDWDPDYPFHSSHSDILMDIADSFNLSLLNPTNYIATRYLDNDDTSNLVIDLMFLRSNSSELNNHFILLESKFPSDHALLVVDLQIMEEFVLMARYTIKENSNEELAYINMTFLTSKKALEDVVNKFTSTQEWL